VDRSANASPGGRRDTDRTLALDRFRDDGALAVEMESAALFALGARAQIAVACVLAVSDTFDAEGARTRIDDLTLLAAAERMGAAASLALAA
jgi:nucleoside phosphorylase